MQVAVRRLHSQCFLYLIAPSEKGLAEIQRLNETFPDYLWRAENAANTDEEKTFVRQIKAGYADYQNSFQRLRADVQRNGPLRNYEELADDNPIRPLLEACEQLLQVNKDFMLETSKETEGVGRTLRIVILLLGLGGPLSGLIIGSSIARGLTKSIYRLSVRVQDVAQRLEPMPDVIDVNVHPEGDIDRVDQQLDQVILRVEDVVKRMQRQQHDMLRAQQLAAVGQLAASVAHEIRNPLMSIKMLVEAALRPKNPRPFTQENLEVVHGAIVRLENTVQTFLDFTRPPALTKTYCELSEVVDRAIALVDARARQQNVRVEANCPAAPNKRLLDGEQVCTVLVNLLLNALDVLPTGGTISISSPDPETQHDLSIVDSGPGISKEMLHKLFTPFSSTKPTGTGLGLCISRRIIEEHGGVIEGGNHPKGGAWFGISFPTSREVRQ